MNSRSVALALCVVSFAIPALAAVKKSGDAAVSFHATGPGGLAIIGESSSLRVAEGGGQKVVFTSELGQLTTGIGLRDTHMKEKYLETPKYPTASLQLDRSAIKFPKNGHGEGDLTGQLTLHGITKSVKVHYVADGGEKAAKFDATSTVDMTDFGIHVPSYLGVTVKPPVKIEVKLALKDQ